MAKASQAISGQIVLDELIDTLMRLVLESAGAQTGCLLLARRRAGAGGRGHGRAADGAGAPACRQAVPAHLPLTLLQYVRRSREPVLLMEASAQHPFAADPYFAQQPPQVRAVPAGPAPGRPGRPAVPGKPPGAQAFPPERVQVLELLASQAAISLDNAPPLCRRARTPCPTAMPRIRRLVESNIIGISLLGCERPIIDANDAFLDMVGYSRQELLSGALNWESHDAAGIPGRSMRNVAQSRADRPLPAVREGIFPQGRQPHSGADRRHPLRRSPDQGVAFVLDLTERKRAETERRSAPGGGSGQPRQEHFPGQHEP